MQKNWTVLLAVVFMVSGLFAGAVSAEESPVGQLYQSFLEGPDKTIFVTFERELLTQGAVPTNRLVKLADGRTVEIHFYQKNYFAFLKSGKRFLVAFSPQPVFTNLSSVLLADRLAGYDGTEHWILDLKNVIKIKANVSSNDVPHPDKEHNRLTVVPDSNTRPGDPNPVLEEILGMATDGYTVAYLGCSYAMAKPPAMVGTNGMKLLDPLSTTFTADLIFKNNGTPGEIAYHPPDPDPKNVRTVNVVLDEEKNTLGVKYSYNGQVVTSTRYQLLAIAKMPDQEAAGMFSWRSYSSAMSNALFFLVKDGTSSQASVLDDGKLVPTQKLYDLLPDQKTIERTRKMILFILIAFSVASAVWMLRLAKPNVVKQNTNKTTKREE